MPYEICGNRQGDLENVYCNSSKANQLLNWKCEKTLNDIVVDAWNYAKTKYK